VSITITATPSRERVAIDLDVQFGGVATLEEFRRLDINGVDDVRLPVLPSSVEAIAVSDYEHALVGPVDYEIAAYVDGVLQRAQVRVTLDGILDDYTWYLHPAVLPQDGVRVAFVDWSLTRSTNSAISTVIGRAAPVVNRDVLGLRRGTVELHAASYDEVRTIITVCAERETMMIRQNDFPGLDGYFEVEQVIPRIIRETARPHNVQWWVTLTVAETERPTGTLLAPTDWTYGAALDEFGTYRASRDELPTYRELLLGVPA